MKSCDLSATAHRERPEGFLEDIDRFPNLTALARGASVGTVVSTEMKHTQKIFARGLWNNIMNAQTLLLDSLNTRWDKYKAELKTCRQEFSEEAVHDFRIAARRLLASLDLLRAVMQDPRIQKMRRVLKDQLDDLDDLRDTQVLLADISETIHESTAKTNSATEFTEKTREKNSKNSVVSVAKQPFCSGVTYASNSVTSSPLTQRV